MARDVRDVESRGRFEQRVHRALHRAAEPSGLDREIAHAGEVGKLAARHGSVEDHLDPAQ